MDSISDLFGNTFNMRNEIGSSGHCYDDVVVCFRNRCRLRTKKMAEKLCLLGGKSDFICHSFFTLMTRGFFGVCSARGVRGCGGTAAYGTLGGQGRGSVRRLARWHSGKMALPRGQNVYFGKS